MEDGSAIAPEVYDDRDRGSRVAVSGGIKKVGVHDLESPTIKVVGIGDEEMVGADSEDSQPDGLG